MFFFWIRQVVAFVRRYRHWFVIAGCVILAVLAYFVGRKALAALVAIIVGLTTGGAALRSADEHVVERTRKVSDAVEERQKRRREEADKLRGEKR